MEIYQEICNSVDCMYSFIRKQRRDFHKYAETGWLEIRTTSIIAARLKELGYDLLIGRDVCLDSARMGLPPKEVFDEQYQRALSQKAIQPYAAQARDGFTGAIGILDCGEGPVIALRFDIDALSIFEEKELTHRPSRDGFCSVNDGMMHACGHDGHAAIGLAVAEVLMKYRHFLKGTIKLIFQPAEEGVRGAKAIVAHGHLDDVDYIIANHLVGSENPDYQIAVPKGKTMATSKLDIIFEGQAAHAGSSPEKGHNAMLAACTAVLNLHAIPRSSSGDSRINVGVMQAGSERNVICDHAKLEMEVRGASTEINQYMEHYARQISAASAQMHDCTCHVVTMGASDSLWSDEDLIMRCHTCCSQILGLRIAPPPKMSGASEDYAFMVNCVRKHGGKGLFFNTLAYTSGPAHSRNFDIAEECLPNAAKVFCIMVFDLMHPEWGK